MQSLASPSLDIDREQEVSPRRPFLRQEILSAAVPAHAYGSNVEISSKGSVRSAHGSSRDFATGARASSQQAPPPGPTHRGNITLPDEDLHPFTLRCVDYLQGEVDFKARVCAENGEDACPDTAQSNHACCVCSAGAQFRKYEDTQCTGDNGLSITTGHSNPLEFVDVDQCMQRCWELGEECDAFSVINSGSSFAGKCVFRKGRLRYNWNYLSQKNQDPTQCVDGQETMVPLPGCGDTPAKPSTGCGSGAHVHECQYYYDGETSTCRACVKDTTTCLTPEIAATLHTENAPLLNCATEQDSATGSGGTQLLPLCSDSTTLSNQPCTDNTTEAAPIIHPLGAPQVTQDDVFDSRDCFVKYLWWR